MLRISCVMLQWFNHYIQCNIDCACSLEDMKLITNAIFWLFHIFLVY